MPLNSVFAETACTSDLLDQTAKIYSDSNGVCHASTGVGFNTDGGTYQCGPVTCPGGSGDTQGRNCVFNEPNYPGQCGTGFTNTIYGGLNPSDAEGGCHWNGAPRLSCASIIPYTYTVKAVVKKADGTLLPNIALHVYDNGHDGADGRIQTTDSTGMISFTSWSGDHVKIWTSDTNYDHNASHPIDITVNTDWACGSDIGWPPDPSKTQKPCVITQTGTANPTGGSGTSLTLIIGLPGFGSDGGVPTHKTRAVNVELYDAASTVKPGFPTSVVLGNGSGVVTYDDKQPVDNNNGNFVGTINNIAFLPNAHLPANNEYVILVKMPQYLYKLASNPTPVDTNNPNAFTITPGSSNAAAPLSLYAGDVAIGPGQANSMTVDDYTALFSCYNAHDMTSSSCPTVSDGNNGTIALADLNDDGKVDIIDFNIWLRSLFTLQAINATPPICSNGACNGD